jgi:hypothetical protein
MFAACVALIFPDGAAPVFFILLDHFLICAGTIRAKTSPAISNVIFSNHLEFLKWDVKDIVEWFFLDNGILDIFFTVWTIAAQVLVYVVSGALAGNEPKTTC